MTKKYNDDDFNNFTFKDLNEMIEKLFGNIGKLPNLGSNKPNTHHHSIIYRFGKGMDKPEIRLDGEKIDETELSDFVNTMGPNKKFVPSKIRMSSGNSVSEIDLKDVSIQENTKQAIPKFEETYFEVDSSNGASVITIELPSVEKDRINISQSGDTVTIIGENDRTSYKVRFNIDYTYNNTQIEGKNSIYQIRITK